MSDEHLPNWEHAPIWANWWTRDENGALLWWENEPYRHPELLIWMDESDGKRAMGTCMAMKRQRPTLPMPDWSRVNPKYQWAWLNPVIDARYGPKFCWRFRETEPTERHEDSKSFLGLEQDYISWFPIDLPLGCDYRSVLRQRPTREEGTHE